jgi:hypothetical protein
MKQKMDVQQGTLALMVPMALKTLDVEAEKRDWELTAAITARFFEVKAVVWHESHHMRALA